MKFAQRRRGKREVIRKGLDISKMKSSWANDVGPSLSFPPATSLTDDEATTAGETDGEITCSGDEDWVASEEIVSATQWIEQSIAEEADVHRPRSHRRRGQELPRSEGQEQEGAPGCCLAGSCQLPWLLADCWLVAVAAVYHLRFTL